MTDVLYIINTHKVVGYLNESLLGFTPQMYRCHVCIHCSQTEMNIVLWEMSHTSDKTSPSQQKATSVCMRKLKGLCETCSRCRARQHWGLNWLQMLANISQSFPQCITFVVVLRVFPVPLYFKIKLSVFRFFP